MENRQRRGRAEKKRRDHAEYLRNRYWLSTIIRT